MTRHTPRWSVCRRLLGAGWPSRRWTTWGRSEPGGWPGWRCRKGGGTRRKRSSWETAETAGWIRRGRRTSTCCTKLWRVGFRGRSSSPLYVCECSWAVTYFNFVCLRVEERGGAEDQLVPARSWEESSSLRTAGPGDGSHCCYRTPSHRRSQRQLRQSCQELPGQGQRSLLLLYSSSQPTFII